MTSTPDSEEGRKEFEVININVNADAYAYAYDIQDCSRIVRRYGVDQL